MIGVIELSFTVKILNKEVLLDKPTRVYELFDNKDYKYLACTVNDVLAELDYLLTCDCEIKLIDISSTVGSRIYRATLRYLIIMALMRINPEAKITFNFSVSKSMYGEVTNIGHTFRQYDLDQIKKELDEIIKADYPIVRTTITKEEAYEYYKSVGWDDKVEILKYRDSDTVHIYECDGFKDYMFGYMLKSTGFIKDYNLRLYSPGFIFQYPRSENGGKIPEFKDERTFRQNLRIAGNTIKLTNTDTIAKINKIVENGKALDYINISESLISRQLVELGNEIERGKDEIRLILVAGPSSSGKTTFTNRLRIELMSRGINPFMISMDDFYKKPEDAPLDENGNRDLEHINALDLDLFDSTILKLVSGDEVRLPKFNFETYERTFTDKIKLSTKTPILIEGIHGLNDRIAPSLPQNYKYKIFICPVVQYKIDDHTPISISDARLVRRIVRDFEFRGASAETTLRMWPSVRSGEFKWIYPYEDNADFVFNSDLGYELSVLKDYAMPLLEKIPKTSDCYIDAKRLIKFLKYYLPITSKWVPCNSLLREFIGESIFYTEDKI